MHLISKKMIRLLAIAGMALLSCNNSGAVPLRVLAWDPEVAAMRLSIGKGKEGTVIEAMHPSKRTKAYQVAAGENPLVIQALDRPDADGKPSTSTIKIPESVKQPLLLVLPDPKAATGIRLLVLEDDTADFAWGSTHFINATGRELVFAAEGKALRLPPSWTPVHADPGGATRSIEVKLFSRDQPARPIYSAIWEHDTDQRTLVFLVPGEDSRLGPVAIKAIPEDRRVIAATRAAADHQP